MPLSPRPQPVLTACYSGPCADRTECFQPFGLAGWGTNVSAKERTVCLGSPITGRLCRGNRALLQTCCPGRTGNPRTSVCKPYSDQFLLKHKLKDDVSLSAFWAAWHRVPVPNTHVAS